MKNNKLAALSNEDLLKQRKSFKLATAILLGAFLILFLIRIVRIIDQGFSGSSLLPVVMLPILLINMNRLREINKEIKTRDLV